MNNSMYIGLGVVESGSRSYPSVRRNFHISGGIILSRQSLPTDPIGSTTVTFDGVNTNSEIRVYDINGSELAGVENCSANHALSWSVFASGSAYNTVRIVVIHPDYKIKEFNYTAKVGSASIPIQQEVDKWYSNP